ncbi:dihydrolipoyl dehydrogenase [Salipiger aestuarii]|uniref:Dihydrolipoyl dehydrogenase n=1 Tax=Salipiger aestuarii TaxID=568098 RepID=A0A327YBM1_9RHOB|nr:dihydrolipoyl dehydrogenase [Salipiger aestuarii]KAA8612174.1 dihydrolipoamide dehydrogenase [Salipiger aestuarii]KAB2539902.1 dihydrolipoamide dehydrogenase [Salipiger aestuarii]RAK18518.1 dihydrolipoamide dehydrogenase [Salipiger aestuarii]
MKIDVQIPDIGDFSNVPVIEVTVALGDIVAEDDPILMLESDKATLDIPAPAAGKVTAIHVSEGDTVSKGSLVMTLEAEGEATAEAPPEAAPARQPVPALQTAASASGADSHAEFLVLGAGPGGYTAAFRAADLGLKVTLIERWDRLGGVCLNVGCIPSKALLHVAKAMDEAQALSAHGVSFAAPTVDLDGVRSFKDGVVGKLTGGLNGLARKRKVTVVRGTGRFAGPNVIRVETAEGTQTVSFDHAVIACGSEPVRLPFLPDDSRVIDSTGALALADIPERMLVVGGGIIGLEMAQVYDALGSKITIVELMDQIIPEADRDLVMPLMKRIEKRYERVLLKTKVTKVEATDAGLVATFDGPNGIFEAEFDKVLVAVGRKPNGALVAADAAGVTVDERGFIPVDTQMRTNQPHIFAIGDVVGQPMLAHKAVHEAKVAAEVACGEKSVFDARVIPSVAYTDPEIAWVGMTEAEAKSKGVKVRKGAFPWAASGRSLSLGRDEGVTKLLFDPDTKRIIGAGITGPNAGDLLAEAVLAIEMGADAEDLALTIHPHPTLSETLGLAAEVSEGTITDL